MKTALDKVLIAICKEKQKIDYIELFSFDFNDFHFDYHGNYYGYGYFKTDPTKEYEYAWNNFDDMLNVPMKHVGKTMCEILNGLSENEIKLSMSYELENILLHRNILERLNSILKNKKFEDLSFILFYKDVVIYLIGAGKIQIRDKNCNIIYKYTVSNFDDLCSVVIPNTQNTIKDIMETTNQQYLILK